MKQIYMSVSITMYSVSHTPDCTFYECIDNGEMKSRKLTLDEAYRLQWELVKAGATRKTRSNLYNPAISTVDVDYWARR